MANRVKTTSTHAALKRGVTRPERPERSPQTTVLYLYGVTDARPGNFGLPPGVDGKTPVEPVACAGLACWVSRVDGREFGERLNQNLRDLDWLAAASVRHQRVVAALAAECDILPARFGTVFLSQDSLGEHIGSRKRSLLRSLERVAGAEEWGVKVFAVAGKQPAVVAKSGREYLERKAAQRQGTGRAASEDVNALAQALREVSLDAAPAGRVAGGQRDLEWQASFLLRRDRRAQFERLLKRYAERWQGQRRIESTGPWPPYSFVSTDGD